MPDLGPATRLPVVAVIGSGTHAHADRAEPLGQALAGLGVHLLTGAGGGVMCSVSRAFRETPGRRGCVIGIVPGSLPGGEPFPRSGYPNEHVEISIFTHLPRSGEQGADPLSRNHIVVLTARVVIALPGGAGTLSEVRLALRYGRPVFAHLASPEELPGLPAEVLLAPDLAQLQQLVKEALPAQ